MLAPTIPKATIHHFERRSPRKNVVFVAFRAVSLLMQKSARKYRDMTIMISIYYQHRQRYIIFFMYSKFFSSFLCWFANILLDENIGVPLNMLSDSLYRMVSSGSIFRGLSHISLPLSESLVLDNVRFYPSNLIIDSHTELKTQFCITTCSSQDGIAIGNIHHTMMIGLSGKALSGLK
jgi:hypothetical protein